MGRSVYSIILNDEIVEEIDRLAYRENTNRSNMINSILAQYVSISTPQDRMREIFNVMERFIRKNDVYKIEPTNTNGTFMIKSAMRYKYNPVIKYCVELYKDNSLHYGCIKAFIRTQNMALINAMNNFFEMLKRIEYEFINFGSVRNVAFHKISNGRLLRQFIINSKSELSDEKVGEAISIYVDNLDNCIKTYFRCIEENTEPYTYVEKLYSDYINRQKIII